MFNEFYRKPVLSAAMMVSLSVVGGVAYGQVSLSRSSSISACAMSDGTLRLVTRATCPSGQRLVQWNSTGPTGPQGPSGTPGPAGPAGPVGSINDVVWSDLPYMSKIRFQPNGGLSTNDVAAAGSNSGCMLGEVRLFAGNFAPKGWSFAVGQLINLSQNQALFAVLGSTYGGDGRATFALPSTGDIRPDGMTHIICTGGTFPLRNP